MNVISVRSIEIAVATAADRVQRPALKAWLERALTRHIRRTERHLVRVKTRYHVEHELGRNDHCKPRPPKELKKKLLEAYDRGEALWIFKDAGPERDELMEEARAVVDWLEAVPEWDRHLKRIDRMSFADASRMAAAWHEKLLTLAADADDPDVAEEIELAADCGDGNRFVELKGPVALFREGRIMGHCVGGASYAKAVATGWARIFSLRDARNQPHVTIEVRRNSDGELEAAQIKGKGNRAPVAQYAALVRPFVVANNWRVSYDGHNIGLVTIAGRTYENADDVLNAVLDGLPRSASEKAPAPRTQGFSRLFEKAPAAHGILTSRMAEIAPSTRKRLFDVLAPSSSDVAIQSEETVLKAPKGVTVERRKAVWPGAFLQALQLGFFAGMENEVAAVLKPLVEETLARIDAAPCHIWMIGVAGVPNGAAMVQQVAAFVGSGKALGETGRRVQDARGGLLVGLAGKIRKEASLGERGETPPEGGWARQLAMLERLKPASVAKIDGVTALLM